MGLQFYTGKCTLGSGGSVEIKVGRERCILKKKEEEEKFIVKIMKVSFD